MDTNEWDSVLSFASEPVALSSPGFSSTCEGKIRVDHGSDGSPTQVPTPPESMNGSPTAEGTSEENIFVSVSTTFYPGAPNDALPPDMTLLSSDSVFFYIHTHVLLGVSSNRFKSLIPLSTTTSAKEQNVVVHVPETAPVLNIILHTVYRMSCMHYSPSFDTLVAAVHQLPSYGIDVISHISPSTPLYSHLLSHAPLFPMDLYALAACYNLYDLAVSTSSHLLSYHLPGLTDELVDRIGPRYLKRLFFLHMGRTDALKRILLPPPHPHPPTPWCDFEEQKRLSRAWALASAYLAWEARPDLSASTLENALGPLAEHLSCPACKEALTMRVKDLVVQWSIVKRTI
ncbi:uncharacterized protein EV420DRAFT_1503602 [Desarmillaria tabescens]|uniref:BTB domain-containing protein n=1 Tax=Armillaria tabescens TaxID=1929756 RepID=A0AA39NML2_ARMTA|nr:uncharacterized protein EV420DRAFT_1503602 [Desarmillaria tabescens]KAK0468274.1 hypothetical protein EV420DRAFT_1503602 [Desarmillaria tabescens]